MKKSEKIAYAVFKVIYILSTIAVFVTYICELLSPTATRCSITGNDWLTLAFMSLVFCVVTEREKKYRDRISKNDSI